MNEMKKALSAILLAGIFLAGCNKGPSTVEVTGITLNRDSAELVAGETFQLVATVEPENATEKEIIFSSNNRSVATVDAAGLVSALSPGEATITVSSVSGGAYKNFMLTVKSEVRNIGEKESANCYIVTEPGLIGFKPFKGNTETLVGNVASVDVIWETVNTATAPEKGTVIYDPQYKDGMVAFRVPQKMVEGNALIAAKDAGGNILWSWHIWVVDGGVGEVVMANNAGILMDRNLGAIGTTPGDPRVNGMFYQWGRKDPFMGIATYQKPFVQYAASAEMEPNAASGPELTVAWTLAHPTAWGLRNDKNNDWLYTADYTTDILRWGSGAAPKALYDPCPPGWQIPGNSGIWTTAGLTTNFAGEIVFDKDNFGCTIGSPYCTPASWWPAVGQLANDYIRGLSWESGIYGGWWTGASTGMGGGTNNAGRDFVLLLASSLVHHDNDYKQFGAAVRCRKITED